MLPILMPPNIIDHFYRGGAPAGGPARRRPAVLASSGGVAGRDGAPGRRARASGRAAPPTARSSPTWSPRTRPSGWDSRRRTPGSSGRHRHPGQAAGRRSAAAGARAPDPAVRRRAPAQLLRQDRGLVRDSPPTAPTPPCGWVGPSRRTGRTGPSGRRPGLRLDVGPAEQDRGATRRRHPGPGRHRPRHRGRRLRGRGPGAQRLLDPSRVVGDHRHPRRLAPGPGSGRRAGCRRSRSAWTRMRSSTLVTSPIRRRTSRSPIPLLTPTADEFFRFDLLAPADDDAAAGACRFRRA